MKQNHGCDTDSSVPGMDLQVEAYTIDWTGWGEGETADCSGEVVRKGFSHWILADGGTAPVRVGTLIQS